MYDQASFKRIKKYVRAADYLSAIQIYLLDNFLLQKRLKSSHIKPRLLGHWGTCPGINFTYAHLNNLIKEHELDMLFVLGPGHGFPAIQANLFLEGTLTKYYKEITYDKNGIAYFTKQFSWPYGFPSHSNPGAPGVILEGGELGYSLSTSYGAVLDNPNLIVACMIGDGEAETGPTATAWHLSKFINPATNGAVLPILHANGYKISGPTIFGRMSNEELRSLFFGYGYEPHIVEGDSDDVYFRMGDVLERCLEAIRFTQNEARKGTLREPPRFPMIILRTPKGWHSIKELNGEKIEGNYLAHQVIAKNAKEDPKELEALESWLRSYRFEELFDGKKTFCDEIEQVLPDTTRRMGSSTHALGGKPVYTPLKLPNPSEFSESAKIPGTCGSSSMRRAGEYLNRVFEMNEENKNFRMMSPDETYSNKLDAVFRTTKRSFMWPLKPWDKDLAPEGRVIEMLSEHSLQGLAQGYVLTGRHMVFASYEAFIQIISSMVDQYAKFLSIAITTPFRGDIPSLNYILTSSGWRQEHNGLSHQNPGFIDDMLNRQGCFVNVYFPADGNTTLVTLDHCLKSKKEINVIVAGKTLEPRWRSIEEAKGDLMEGLRIWDFASDEDPDIVIAAVGDYLTKEALASIDIVKREAPEIRMRFVNILSLSAFGFGHSSCRVLLHDFDDYFTKDKPVIINFHGYPQTIKQILFDYGANENRFIVHGYEEHGSTTTPFDMQVRNETSRYNLAFDIFERAAKGKVISESKKNTLVKKYEMKLAKNKEHIIKYGVDLPDITDWQWKK